MVSRDAVSWTNICLGCAVFVASVVGMAMSAWLLYLVTMKIEKILFLLNGGCL